MQTTYKYAISCRPTTPPQISRTKELLSLFENQTREFNFPNGKSMHSCHVHAYLHFVPPESRINGTPFHCVITDRQMQMQVQRNDRIYLDLGCEMRVDGCLRCMYVWFGETVG